MLQVLHVANEEFTEDTHKATAFQEAAAQAMKNFDTDNNEPVMGTPQRIKLPFKVEEEIVSWECQAFNNNDEDFLESVENKQQFFFVLSIDLQSVEKIRKSKKTGGLRLLGSPTRTPDDGSELGDDGAAMAMGH